MGVLVHRNTDEASRLRRERRRTNAHGLHRRLRLGLGLGEVLANRGRLGPWYRHSALLIGKQVELQTHVRGELVIEIAQKLRATGVAEAKRDRHLPELLRQRHRGNQAVLAGVLVRGPIEARGCIDPCAGGSVVGDAEESADFGANGHLRHFVERQVDVVCGDFMMIGVARDKLPEHRDTRARLIAARVSGLLVNRFSAATQASDA